MVMSMSKMRMCWCICALLPALLVALLSMALVGSAPPDLSPSTAHPQLALAIVTFRRHDMLERLLHSIAAQQGPLPGFEVLLVDNGCLPETELVARRRFKGVRYIPQCANIGYARANNLAAELASPSVEWLLFLNDDTELWGGFLHNLWLVRALFEEGLNRTIGAMGCKSVWPDGRLVEAGSIVYNNGFTDNYGRRDSPDLPQYSFVRSVHYSSGACFMVRRALYTDLGGMNANVYEAYFEDTDLAMSIAHKRGLPIIYNPFAAMLHDEHASFGGSATAKLMEKSGKVFLNRWVAALEMFHPTIPNPLDFADVQEADTARFVHARDAQPVGVAATSRYHAIYVIEDESVEALAPLLFSAQHVRPTQLVTLFVLRTSPATGARFARLAMAVQAFGVEVFQGSAHALHDHLASRKLFYQVACMADSSNAASSAEVREQLGEAGLPLFRLNLQGPAEIQTVTSPRPSVLKSLPNNQNLAFALLRASRHASIAFPEDVRDAVVNHAANAQKIQEWLQLLQDDMLGIQAPAQPEECRAGSGKS